MTVDIKHLLRLHPKKNLKIMNLLEQRPDSVYLVQWYAAILIYLLHNW